MSSDLSKNSTTNIFSQKPVSVLTSIFAVGLISALSFTTVLNSFSDFKSIVNQSNFFQQNNLALVSSAAVTTTIDKWHPGIYVKVEDWQLQNPKEMSKIYQELIDTPSIRGIKVVAKWGRYETRDTTTGISTYNFTQIDEILTKLQTLDNKHLILAVPWREFKGSLGASEILPNDMREGQVWNVDPTWQHTDYDYLWAYKMSNKQGQYGYNLKLWDPVVISRLDAFLAALAKHVDNNPNFNHITSTESAIGDPVVPFVSGEGSSLQEAGQIEVIRMMKKHFVNSYVIPDFNYSRQQVANAVPILVNEGIGIGSSNSNKNRGLIATSTPPGVLTYYPELSGKIILAPEIQGDDYESTYGAGTAIDYPSYESIYKRVRDDLKANYTVMQRNTPFWLGSSTASIPSVLKFLQTYPDIINDTTGAGGLNSVKPAMLGMPTSTAPELTFTATPLEISSGSSSTFTWSAVNAATCTASDSWSGIKSTNSNEVVSIMSTTTTTQIYTLTCEGQGGSVSKSVILTVNYIDNEAPTTPVNLSTSGITTDSITLNWSPSTDNISVSGYNVYRDGQMIGTTNSPTYTDSALVASTAYNYTVTAIDVTGNESVKSNVVSVNTNGISLAISSYSASAKTSNSATVSIVLNKLGTVVVKYGTSATSLRLSAQSTTLNTNHSLNLTRLDKKTTYYYQISATDQSGKIVTSPIATFKTPDKRD